MNDDGIDAGRLRREVRDKSAPRCGQCCHRDTARIVPMSSRGIPQARPLRPRDGEGSLSRTRPARTGAGLRQVFSRPGYRRL
jgi:hypothetical protein